MRDHELDDTAIIARHRRDGGERRETGDQGRDVAAGLAAVRGAGRRLDPASVLHLQRTAGNAAVGSLMEDEDTPSPVHDVVGGGGGQSLDAGLRSEMETRMGHDFSGVRLHTDAAASDSARSVGAEAYTTGRDIVFQAGRYSPDTDSGKQMLAHELTHVVQQSRGAVEATPMGGGIAVSHPADRFEQEAEANAKQVMATPVGETATSTGGSAVGRSVQRAAVHEEGQESEAEEVQRAVQRKAGAEEDESEAEE